MNKYEIQDEKIKKLESLGYKLSRDEVTYYNRGPLVFPYVEANSNTFVIKDKDGNEVIRKEIFEFEDVYNELDRMMDAVIKRHEETK